MVVLIVLLCASTLFHSKLFFTLGNPGEMEFFLPTRHPTPCGCHCNLGMFCHHRKPLCFSSKGQPGLPGFLAHMSPSPATHSSPSHIHTQPKCVPKAGNEPFLYFHAISQDEIGIRPSSFYPRTLRVHRSPCAGMCVAKD